MSDKITLHPKFGVNPTIGQCFYCGKDTGEIGLLGRNGGKEAPRHTVLSYDPCEECQKNMALGIALIGVREQPVQQGQPPIATSPVNLYPTGSWAVVRYQAIDHLFNDPDMNDKVKSMGKAFVDQDALDHIIAANKK